MNKMINKIKSTVKTKGFKAIIKVVSVVCFAAGAASMLKQLAGKRVEAEVEAGSSRPVQVLSAAAFVAGSIYPGIKLVAKFASKKLDKNLVSGL